MPLSFKLRENDIVDTRLELEQSIINNLYVYFEGLPKKFIYKISIVPSVTTKDGTNIKGASHQVLVSTSKAGVKKYKTIYNKWAVLDISVKTEGGVVRKLDRIVLAPIDILSYNPTLSDLDTQSNSIGLLVSTGNITAPTATQSSTTPPTSTSAVSNTPPASTPTASNGKTKQDYINAIIQSVKLREPNYNPADAEGLYNRVLPYATQYGSFENAFLERTGVTFYWTLPASVPVTVPVVNQTSTPTTSPAPSVKPGANANTLYEWYQAQGQALPSVTDRSVIYEGFGLGPKGTYVGTAEQNDKLLNKLKAK